MARQVLRMEQVAERINMPLNTLRWKRARGEGPPLWRQGGRVVAFADEVDAWLDEQAHGPLATGRSASA